MTVQTVEEYLHRLDGWQASIVNKLRGEILSVAPEVKERIVWGQLVFELNGPVIYLQVHPSHVQFGLWRATDIHDPYHLLEGGGKRVRYIRYTQHTPVRLNLIRPLIQQTIALNRRFGDPTHTGHSEEGET